MFVGVVRPDYLFRWHVQLSVYCTRQIHAHLRCTQCSIMLHLIDICFLWCICLWQISKIQTCLCVVVGPGFVSTLPALMRSSDSHPADPRGRLGKTVNRAPNSEGGRFQHKLHSSLSNRCDHLYAVSFGVRNSFFILVIYCFMISDIC